MVTAEADGLRGGMTVSSLICLSLEAHLVGISIALSASLHRVLDASRDWAVSILSGEQEHLARHFAQSLQPGERWRDVDVRTDDPRLLSGAAGWLVARTVDRFRTGDHTFFVGEVVACEQGPPSDSLAYVHHGFITC